MTNIKFSLYSFRQITSARCKEKKYSIVNSLIYSDQWAKVVRKKESRNKDLNVANNRLRLLST